MSAAAQASGTLTVSATVQGSINLAFNTDAAGVGLTGSGSNAATLAYGTVQAYGGTVPTNVTRSVQATTFTISTPVDVNVSKYNSSSLNFTLKAQLGTADANGNAWTVGGVAVTSASAATITGTGAYATNVPEAVAIAIPLANTGAALNIANTINFTATAN